VVVDTVNSPLAEPMRAACADLTEVTFNAGHWLAQERRDEVNAAITQWLTAKQLK
jgi:soluble epoxide hydrolase/lipid-phosphate phosphatase